MATLRELWRDVTPYIRAGVKQYIVGAIAQIEYLAGLADASEDPNGIKAKMEEEYQVELHLQDRIVIRQRLVRIVADKLATSMGVDYFVGIQEKTAEHSHKYFNMQFVWDNMLDDTYEQIKNLIENNAMDATWLSRQISGYANWIAKHVYAGLEEWLPVFVDEVMGEEWASDPDDIMSDTERLDRAEQPKIARQIHDDVHKDMIPRVWRHFHLFNNPAFEWSNVYRDEYKKREVPREMLRTFEPDVVHHKMKDGGQQGQKRRRGPKRARTF